MQRDHQLATVPFFDGLMAGEPCALIESFAGEPELHHPVRGRIRGARAFEALVAETNVWLSQRNVSVEMSTRSSPSDTASRRWCSTSTVRRGDSVFPSRSSQLYELLFSNGGGIPLEHCALIDDERACALEYNVARWGRTELPPQGGGRRPVSGRRTAVDVQRLTGDERGPARDTRCPRPRRRSLPRGPAGEARPGASDGLHSARDASRGRVPERPPPPR